MTDVCAADGVPVLESRSGRLVHTDEIPAGIDPDHEVEAIPREAYWQRQEGKRDVALALADLIIHHETLHPSADCPWVARARLALKTR